VAQTLTRARQLCEQLDRPTQLALVLSDECESHVFRAELVLACKKSKELLDLADAGTDLALKLRSRLCCALSWIHLGEFVAARAHAEQALALCDPAHPVLWIADSQVLALVRSCRSLTTLGHLDHASLRREQAIAQSRRRGHAFTLAIALSTSLSQHAAIQSDPAILLQRADELAALSAEHGFAHWIAVATSWRGWCLSALGRTEEGLTAQTEALAAHRATRTLLNLPLWLTRLADAYMKAGRAKEGLKQLDEATNLVESTGERWSEADMHRTRGDLLMVAGDRAAAEVSFHQAINVACRQSAKLFELRAAASLARLWLDQGKRAEAHDLLAPIYGWFTEGFDTPVLQDAKALLDELA
jgi:predicted ATPase